MTLRRLWVVRWMSWLLNELVNPHWLGKSPGKYHLVVDRLPVDVAQPEFFTVLDSRTVESYRIHEIRSRENVILVDLL